MTSIAWFRRDLRLADNPALRAACEGVNAVVPVYIHAPEEEGEWPPGAASRWWLHHSLAALAQDLGRIGSRLLIMRGPTLPALLELAATCGADEVHWNRLHEPALAARDAAVRQGLEQSGVTAREHDAALLFAPGTLMNRAELPFRVFTPFWRAAAARLDEVGTPLPAPARLPQVPDSTKGLALDDLGLLPSVRWDSGLAEAWTPGEDSAHRRLADFAEAGLAGYPQGRDRPDRGGTSRLSPHLHFGEVGPRQVLAAIRHAGGAGSEAYLREIGWREFASHLLHHFPHTSGRPLDERFEHLDWRQDRDELAAWQHGRTGFPIVDAGMRELWQTGWMHNRVRMIVASLLTKNLFMHWVEGARWFWDTLVDADLANNSMGWQWTAGCGADAAPYFRIFNPVLQGRKFDPEGAYVRRWVPELAGLADRDLHEPWRAPVKGYPAPLVDLKSSRVRALERFQALKRDARR